MDVLKRLIGEQRSLTPEQLVLLRKAVSYREQC
jgi:hypothetical protein